MDSGAAAEWESLMLKGADILVTKISIAPRAWIGHVAREPVARSGVVEPMAEPYADSGRYVI
jgi:hypothetical protein